MKSPLRTSCLLAGICAVAIALPWSLSWGEVTRSSDPEPVPSEQQIEPVPLTNGLVLRAQCWQEGVKVIDQGGLRGIDLNTLTRDRSVSFKRQNEKQPSVFLLALGQAGLCLVQPDG